VVPVLVLRAGALFDGEVRRSGADLLVEDGRVVAVEDSAPPPSDAELVDLGADVTLLPGLVDAHQHLVMDASAGVVDVLNRSSDDELAAQARRAAAAAVAAGVTTVRDLGDRGYVTLALRDALAADPAAGPRLVVSGPPLTTVGGHCWFLGGEVDGVEQVRAAVAERAERGVDVVKVFATGGHLTPGSDPGAAQFAPDELSALVAEVHRHGLPVAVHAHGRDGIAAALSAGADTIEHFSFMTADSVVADDALVDAVVAAGMRVVLTPGSVPGKPSPLPDAAVQLPLLLALQRRLVEVGVWVALGTDGGVGPNKPHDVMPYAVAMTTWTGRSPMEALTAATARAGEAVGLGGQVGVLRPGAAADVLAVNGDPTVDVDALVDVVAVYRAGRRVAGALRRPPAVRPPIVS
jgi:imidazolonepropionase-like amidohydrolase